MKTVRRWQDRHQAAGDEGFGLVELTVAMFIISIGLLGLMYVQVGSLKTVTESGQRQASTALANRVMEQMRALPYSTLTGGLVCANLAGDPNVQFAGSASACTATFRPAYDSTISEPVVVYAPPSGGALQVKPLNPHVQLPSETKVGRVQYDVRAYVTRVNPDPSVDAGYWLTVISTWTKPGTSQLLSTASRSRVYAPKGCLSANAAPFTGPCQAFFYSEAGLAGGGLTVSSNRANQPLVDGLATRQAVIDFASVSTRIQSEQVVSSQSTVTTAASKLITGTGETRAGGLPASSSADTDPASGTAAQPLAPSSASGGGNLSDVGGGSQFSIAADIGSSVSAFSTTVSSASPSCADEVGTDVNNSQACTSARADHGSASVATLQPAALGTRTLSLASVAASSTPARAWGARYISGTTTRCTGTSGAGCISAAVRRNLGIVTAGGLASLATGDTVRRADGIDVTSTFIASPGSAASPRPLVSITGYDDGATTEAGVNPSAGSPRRNGSLVRWNGTGFTSTALSSTSAGTFVVPAVEGRYGTTTVRVSGKVIITAASDTPAGAAPCKTAPCSRTRTGGTIVATLTYQLTNGGTVVGDFDVTVDLGTALSQTVYKAAPDA